MSFDAVLIANRGEIAVRIIRACQALGIKAIQAHSEADADSLAARMADETVSIGPPPAAKSYLNIDSLIEAAKKTGADAVHPGYGFLAENGEFADAVVAAGLSFIGPSGDAIRLLGDKVAARRVAAEAGVPTVPGSEGGIDDMADARALVETIGFPVMIKAAAGGGGRGIRIASSLEEFETAFPMAATEATSSFGDGRLYVEKVIDPARHVEVQILGDGEHFVHCFERECSLQRRRQKVWEEAPAFDLPDKVRAAMCESAVALARQVSYRGAGTVEYLYDPATEAFYFIEVNTRIQVEHPVTEMITGIDLVQTMIRIAAGESLPFAQEQITYKGHAIECRLNAEDPAKNFMPWPGVIESVAIPEGSDVRFDSLLYDGYAVPPFYDSLLGKLIVYADDRAACLERLGEVLGTMRIDGIPTTIPLHQKLAADASVANGQFDTKFLESWLETAF